MTRVLPFSWLALSVAQAMAESPPPGEEPPPRVSHLLTKEPTYRAKPKYSLMAFGGAAEVKVWMVEDGDSLWLDKNADSDLTDDGSPLVPAEIRGETDGRLDFSYKLDGFAPPDCGRHTFFELRCWNYGDKEDSYGLSVWVDGRIPMYAGWFGTFWSASHETAPVIQLAGPFKPIIMRRDSFRIGESK